MFIAYLIFKLSFFFFFFFFSKYLGISTSYRSSVAWMNMTIYPIQQKKRKEYWLFIPDSVYTLLLTFCFKIFFFLSFTTIWRESRKVQCQYVPWKLIYSFSVNSEMSFSWITFYDEVLTLVNSLIIYKFKIKLWSLAAEVW